MKNCTAAAVHRRPFPVCNATEHITINFLPASDKSLRKALSFVVLFLRLEPVLHQLRINFMASNVQQTVTAIQQNKLSGSYDPFLVSRTYESRAFSQRAVEKL